MESKIRVHLVHGTWPSGGWLAHRLSFPRLRRIPWYEQGSPFREALLRALPPTATCSSFTWSGKNSIRARCQAADDFQKYLLRETSQHPACLHYAVAHSHGGNIVLQALLALESLPKTMSGVIALGTPFLWFESQKAGLLWKGIACLSQMAALSFVVGLSASALVTGLVQFLPPVAFFLAFFFVACLGLFCLALGSPGCRGFPPRPWCAMCTRRR